MYAVLIRELIQSRLESSFHIYQRGGIEVPRDQVLSEYKSIRQFLLDHSFEANSNCIAIKQTKDYRYFLTILASLDLGGF